MYKKILLSLLLTLNLSLAAHAQITPEITEEAILIFHSFITVNADNSIDVTEEIAYETGPNSHHGIYRDIYPYSSTGKKMNIENISVVNHDEVPHTFTTSKEGKNIRIKIGDPEVEFKGTRIYVIRYHATKAVAHLDDIDEIYWDVTGNEWAMPIYETSASVVLPPYKAGTQAACYMGIKGSTETCKADLHGSARFDAMRTLEPGEGMTVAFGFPKGIVEPYSASSEFWEKYLPLFIAIAMPLVTLILSLWYWYKKGRDPKGRNVIVPQYDVPEDLTPMEVAGIVTESVRLRHLSAEIIYLATQGYLKINELETKHLGFIKSKDYELVLLKDAADIKNKFDKKLVNGLFAVSSAFDVEDLLKLRSKNPTEMMAKLHELSKMEDAEDEGLQDVKVAPHTSVKLSDLKYVFHSKAQSVVKSVLGALVEKKYYKNLGRMKGRVGFIVFAFVLAWSSIVFGPFVAETFLNFDFNPFILVSGVLTSFLTVFVVSHFNPSKTQRGVELKEHLLGLKMYLQIAERDRLLFHNAPDKKPEVFEKFLPFAMVLGVADIWAKEFEGIYMTQPSWYGGSNNTAFNALTLSHSLSDFSSASVSSLSAVKGGSGGSGGGGSSGGGGGGGGGGSW